MGAFRFGKRAAVLGFLIIAAVAILGSTQTWFTFALIDTGATVPEVNQSGSGLTLALSLCMGAAAAALSIASKVLRYVILLVLAAAGVLLTVTTVSMIANPIVAALSELTRVTGFTGEDTLREYVESVQTTFWPFLTASSGILNVMFAAIVLFGHGRWQTGGQRYDTDDGTAHQRTTADGTQSARLTRDLSDDRIAEWDALTKGDDPSA